jgi:hypothetical protein
MKAERIFYDKALLPEGFTPNFCNQCVFRIQTRLSTKPPALA